MTPITIDTPILNALTYFVTGYGNKMANIKDIAKKAGVSVATVSRVINNKSDVSEAMRSYIKKIMADVGYVPNTIAKNLSHGSSNLIAVMLPTLDTPFFSEMLAEIENQANNSGYNILLFNSSDNREKVEFYLNSMKSNFVCGAIISSLAVTQKDIEGLENSGIRTVTFDRTSTEHAYSSIKVRHTVGGELATQHLIDAGCQHPIMITGARDDKITQQRMAGFKSVMRTQLNNENPTVIFSDLTSPGGYDAMKNYLEQNNRCDGVFCANDAMAFGAIRACADLGLRVPEDIAVVGYDNSTIGRFYLPALSSIDQRLNDVGRLAVEAIVNLIKSAVEPVHANVSPELVIRESTHRVKRL